MERYSALAVELETIGYFLALHEILLDPINTQYPDVDVLVSGQPDQLVSESP